ncbi:MAG: SdpI family protein [Acidobacteriota bacterium]|nr:SdpI family protein [Acidobacteriota bacterium]
MTQNVGIPLVFIAVGALFAALGVPLWRGRVPPNFWYGCRTRKTLSDERLWYAVNRVTGRDMTFAGAAIAACAVAVLLFWRGANTNATTLVLLCVMLVAIFATGFDSLRTSGRM